jgi:hypothetical protein
MTKNIKLKFNRTLEYKGINKAKKLGFVYPCIKLDISNAYMLYVFNDSWKICKTCNDSRPITLNPNINIKRLIHFVCYSVINFG